MFFHSLSSHPSFLSIVHNSSYIRESCDNDTENIRDRGQETGKSALSTGGGKEKKRKKEKRRKRKKRKEPSVHFPDSIPLCHSSSFFLPLFIVLRHRSLLLFHSSPSSRLLLLFPPLLFPRLHIFPPFSRLVRYRSSSERHCRTSPFFFGRFHERRVFSKLRLHTPPPHADRVRVTENGAVTMAFSSDWLIRYTVIRFFCRRFKILFSYSIRFHEANIERIFPPEFPEFRMKFYRGTTRHSCHWCYLVSVVSRFVLSFRLLADTWYSNSSNNYANIIRIIYKIDADINTLVGPFQRNSMN